MNLIVFSPNRSLLEEFQAAGSGLSCVHFTEGNGLQASRRCGMSAMIMTTLQAERFGVSALSTLRVARIEAASVEDVSRGLPSFIVSSVRMAISEPRQWKSEVFEFLRAAVEAIHDFNRKCEAPIVCVGVLAENLLPEKIGVDTAVDCLRHLEEFIRSA